MARIRVGISGWTYEPWRGNFYPGGLPRKLELAYASRRFGTLEINGTFYSLQKPATFAAWRDAAPAGFVFAVKGGRFITHIKRLREIEAPLANFFASGPAVLGPKLGPFLWQFPPSMRFDEGLFRGFFELLPRDTTELATLAGRHDERVDDGPVTAPGPARRVRHAVEFRHESFLDERFIALLRESNIAMVVADVAEKFPTAEDITADWVYIRLHGSRNLYASGYRPREIEEWARKIETWAAGGEPEGARRIGPPARARRARDVYVYFDNTDVKLRAPIDAARLAERLGVGPGGTAADVASAVVEAATGAGATATPRGERSAARG